MRNEPPRSPRSPREEVEDTLLKAWDMAFPAGIGLIECREIAEYTLRCAWAAYRAGLAKAWADDPDPE